MGGEKLREQCKSDESLSRAVFDPLFGLETGGRRAACSMAPPEPRQKSLAPCLVPAKLYRFFNDFTQCYQQYFCEGNRAGSLLQVVVRCKISNARNKFAANHGPPLEILVAFEIEINFNVQLPFLSMPRLVVELISLISTLMKRKGETLDAACPTTKHGYCSSIT